MLNDATIISAVSVLIGAVIGAAPTLIIYYKKNQVETRKILNESIHYLLEVFFQVNRLNAEKMLDEYMGYYLVEVKKKFPTIDNDTENVLKNASYQKLKENIVPTAQKQALDSLEKLAENYENMVADLAKILPINAFYLRGKNQLADLLQMMSVYFENIQKTDLVADPKAKDLIEQMQSSLTMQLVDEYKDDLKKELFVLLGKTNWSTYRFGKRTIKGIESSILSESEKQKTYSMITSIADLIVKNSKGQGG